MKISDIAKKNGFNRSQFEVFIRNQSDIRTRMGMIELVVNDEDVAKAVARYHDYTVKDKVKKLPMITTTPSFEHKKITDYLGPVSGTDIYAAGGIIGEGLANQETLFTSAFNKAKSRMWEKALELGADGIVGMSFSVSSPGSIGSMIVAVVGTAVCFEAEINNNNNDMIEQNQSKEQHRDEEQGKEKFGINKQIQIEARREEEQKRLENLRRKNEKQYGLTRESKHVICPSCGEENLKSEMFCIHCGEKL